MLYSNEQTRIKTEIYIVNRSKSIPPPQISANVLQAQSFDVELFQLPNSIPRERFK